METQTLPKNGTASAEAIGNSTIEEFVQPKYTHIRTIAKVIMKALSESEVKSNKYESENITLVFFDSRWSWDQKCAFVALFNHLGLNHTVRYKNRTLTFRLTVAGKPYLIIGYSIRALKDDLNPDYVFDVAVSHDEISDLMRKRVAEPKPEDYDTECDGNKK